MNYLPHRQTDKNARALGWKMDETGAISRLMQVAETLPGIDNMIIRLSFEVVYDNVKVLVRIMLN